MTTRPALLALAAGLPILWIASAARGIDLYGWQTTGDISTWSLVHWQNPPSGGTTRVGNAGRLSFDPAFSPGGILWGTAGSDVFAINTTIGSIGTRIPVTDPDFAPDEFLIGLTFSPSGTMYSWSLNDTTSGIYTINPSTGIATTIVSNTFDTLFGMTFSPAGSLYASNGSQLFRLNPATGAVVQTVGSFSQFITSLGYGPDGILRGLSPTFDGTGTTLYTINPANAGLSFLGHSAEDIYGVAAIPGPGTGVIVGVMLVFGGRRRRR